MAKQNAPTLAEIEKSLTRLSMKRESLDKFLAGDNSELDPIFASEMDKEKLVIYAQVLQVKHYESMAMTFPLTEKLLGDDWDDLIEEYRQTCPPTNYRSNRAGEYFRKYIESQSSKPKFPYLSELVDYEFSETEIIDFDDSEFDYGSHHCLLKSAEDFADFRPLANPAMVLRRYQYPILSIVEKLEEDSDDLPGDVPPGPSSILIFRDREDNDLHYLSLGPVAGAIVEHAMAGTHSYAELVGLALSMNPGQDPQRTMADFISLVESYHSKQVFVGHRKIQN